MKIEIYDFYDLDYKIAEDGLCIEYKNIPYALINEVIETLGGDKAALKAYFMCLACVSKDIYNVAENPAGIAALEKAGYLKRRMDGKFCFYTSIMAPEEISVGDEVYDNWDPEVDSLKDIDEDREKGL